MFLPVNTTSKLQPLDAGIIKNFKVHYRRQLLKYTLSRIREGSSETASVISESVSVLDAIRWIKQAWEDVSTKTITNCFHHCGAFPSQEDEDQGDPFADLDDMQDPDIANLNELVTRLNPEITAEQYLEDEEGLSTCDLFDGITDANWHDSYNQLLLTRQLPREWNCMRIVTRVVMKMTVNTAASQQLIQL